MVLGFCSYVVGVEDLCSCRGFGFRAYRLIGLRERKGFRGMLNGTCKVLINVLQSLDEGSI